MVFGDGFRQGSFGNIAKRLFDLAMSSALLLVCAPVLLFAVTFLTNLAADVVMNRLKTRMEGRGSG